ncbi:serine/threonine-protein kinase [Spirillospora sp. NBC_01491]|uniref:serine/threonine-protein kinase n=1 Tax=Spirillospora sp. NBC_01491 TaxID=2976007 RepID=UPI002E2FB338|nr:serine/threonine-protein kinase [Spirillospora sp. NBC_01491]
MRTHQSRSPSDDVRPLESRDPRTVGGYPLLGRIGAGGMGTVYLGRDPGSGERVAVKTLHPHLTGDPAYLERFRDEAVLAARVASFCTARVLARGEDDGRPYIISDYVGGMSLLHRVVRGGPMPAADLHGVAVGVASALAAIHSAGLVHRDLKPANVMLTLSGCRVIDFGIARPRDAPGSYASSGPVLGTPGWMSPEVIRGGAASPAADVFAWGCMVAYAGTGRLPFGEGDASAVALRMLYEEPDLTGLPRELVPAVRSALAKPPRERPEAADLLLTLIERTEPAAVPELGAAPDPHPRATERAAESTAAWSPAESFASTDAEMSRRPCAIRHRTMPQRALRPRLLAGAGAVLLASSLALGMGGRDGDEPAAPDTPKPAASVPPIKQAGVLRPRKSKPQIEHKERHHRR